MESGTRERKGGHTNTSNGVGDWGEEGRAHQYKQWSRGLGRGRAGTPIQAMESGTGERKGGHTNTSNGVGDWREERAGTPMELGTKGGILHAISK